MNETGEEIPPQVAEVLDDAFYNGGLFSAAHDGSEPSDGQLRDLQAEADIYLAEYAEAKQTIPMPEADETVESDSLRAYFRSIGLVALLEPEEEVMLAQRIEAGLLAERALADRAMRRSLSKRYKTKDLQQIVHEGVIAKDQFFKANLLLVAWHAKRMRFTKNYRQSLLDMIQWGNIGLQHAVERFDYTQGFRFSTYASYWIRKLILENRRQNYALSASEYAVAEVRRMSKIANEFFTDNGRDPKQAELAELMGVSVKRVYDLMGCRQEVLQLNDLGRDNDEDFTEPLLAMLAGEDDVEASVLKSRMTQTVSDWLDDVLVGLAGRYNRGALYADFVRRRFGLSGPAQTREELAEFYGKHKESLRLWEKKSLAYIRARALQDKDKLK